jgi:hypothetical protein
MPENQTTDFQDWLEREIEDAKNECRRLAKRDGVPLAAIEALFEKLRGGNAGTA